MSQKNLTRRKLFYNYLPKKTKQVMANIFHSPLGLAMEQELTAKLNRLAASPSSPQKKKSPPLDKSNSTIKLDGPAIARD